MGITQYTPFGKKYLPWFAVADYREWFRNRSATNRIMIQGQNGVRIVIWEMSSGYTDLKAEIERHAPAPRTGFNPPNPTKPG